MCIEHFRYLMSRHKTIWCPSNTIEDGVSLHFFSVDLSRRKAVLLRGGPRRKGLGGIITYTSSFIPSFFLGSSSVFPASLTGCCCGCGSTAPGSTVVPRGGAVVPQVPMVVPRSPSGSTALCSQAVVPPLCGSTMSGFCFFHFSAEVGTDVSLFPG